MKKTKKIALGLGLALVLLIGCGSTSAFAAGGTVLSGNDAGTISADAGSTVTKRDASGEYDASAAVTLSPEDDLAITEAGVYILSGTYENSMIVVDAGEEDKVQLVLDNAEIM